MKEVGKEVHKYESPYFIANKEKELDLVIMEKETKLTTISKRFFETQIVISNFNKALDYYHKTMK